MTARIRIAAVALAVAAALVAGAAVAAGPGLQGRWRLVEQTYGAGDQNLAPRGEGLRLEVGEGLLEGRVSVWLESDPSDVRPWPEVFDRSGTATLEVLERVVDRVGGTLAARYRVDSGEPGGLSLEIEERYALEDEVLVGRVAIAMFRDGERRGGYVLDRRFERLP